jgi:hypothetical protein
VTPSESARAAPAGPEEVLSRPRAARDALLRTTASDLAKLLGSVGERFLQEGDPLRAEALARVPGEAGLSSAMVSRVVDGMARDWTTDRLATLLQWEFPDPSVLDGFVAQPGQGEVVGGSRRLRALGDGVALHIGAGSVPGVCATSLIRSLLVKTPVLVKPGGGDRALTELFLRGLREADPAVGAAGEVVYWPAGSPGPWAETPALVDRVVVYGSDRAARAIRDTTPVHVPVVVYHHRSGVAVVGSGALTDQEMDRTARALAFAASTFDQRGCVSPHRVWVFGDAARVRAFGEALAAAMARESEQAPPGPVDPPQMARAQQVRATAEMRRSSGGEVTAWWKPGDPWTVVLEEPGATEPLGAPRSVVVLPAVSQDEVERALAPDAAHLQTVGLAGLDAGEEAELVERLSRLGASRLVPLGEMSFPPAWWIHDGKGPLRALVRWAEWTR